MAARGRTSGFVMSDEHRTKIANSQILKCLIEHTEGKREMSATQVTAGLGLLKKVMPDLANVEVSGKNGGPVHITLNAAKLSDEALDEILAASAPPDADASGPKGS